MKTFVLIFLGLTFATLAMKSQTPPVIEGRVYSMIGKQPEFIGGEMALMSFLMNNIRYPVHAKDNGISGQVIIGFIVSKTGKVDSIKVLKSVDKQLDLEALRVVRLMSGHWKPGMLNDTAVNVRYVLPVTFSLHGVKTESDYYNEGVSYSQKGDNKNAITSFEHALEMNPADIDALYNCAILKIKANDMKGACEQLNKIKQLGKHDADELLLKYCK